jgi:hypothetical protein
MPDRTLTLTVTVTISEHVARAAEANPWPDGSTEYDAVLDAARTAMMDTAVEHFVDLDPGDTTLAVSVASWVRS